MWDHVGCWLLYWLLVYGWVLQTRAGCPIGSLFAGNRCFSAGNILSGVSVQGTYYQAFKCREHIIRRFSAEMILSGVSAQG